MITLQEKKVVQLLANVIAASVFLGVLLTLMTGCGHDVHSTRPPNPGTDVPSYDNPVGVVHGTAVFLVAVSRGQLQLQTASASQTITVVNNSSSGITLSAFSQPPAITPDSGTGVVSLGTLQLADLFDNSINVCGTSSNQHCGHAGLRIYNFSVNGLANGSDATDVVPLSGVPAGGSAATFGVGSASAVVLQTITIPNSQHNVKLSNFNPAPSYAITGDFGAAGAGTFTGKVVLEYFLYP